VNAEDRRRLEELQLLVMRWAEKAEPGTTLKLKVRIGRDGHVCRTSSVRPELRSGKI
jgi:hypothetical protein